MGLCSLQEKMRREGGSTIETSPEEIDYDTFKIKEMVIRASGFPFDNFRNSKARTASYVSRRIFPSCYANHDLDSFFNTIIETIKYQLTHGKESRIITDYPDSDEGWEDIMSAPAACVAVARLAISSPPNIRAKNRRNPYHLEKFCTLLKPLWSALTENHCSLFASFLDWLSTVIDEVNKNDGYFFATSVLYVLFHQQLQQATDPDLVSVVLRVFEQRLGKEEHKWLVLTLIRVFWVRGACPLMNFGHYKQILDVTLVAEKMIGISALLELFDIELISFPKEACRDFAKEIVRKAVNGGGSLEELLIQMDHLLSSVY